MLHAVCQKHIIDKDTSIVWPHYNIHHPWEHKLIFGQHSLSSNKNTSKKTLLTKEPHKPIMRGGVSIQLQLPKIYYAIEGEDKQEVPQPLDQEAIARIPEPKYYKADWQTFTLLSIYFVMTIDYCYVIQRAIRKRVQLFQGRPGQTHPLDRV
jgi:hypothetical protein